MNRPDESSRKLYDKAQGFLENTANGQLLTSINESHTTVAAQWET